MLTIEAMVYGSL